MPELEDPDDQVCTQPTCRVVVTKDRRLPELANRRRSENVALPPTDVQREAVGAEIEDPDDLGPAQPTCRGPKRKLEPDLPAKDMDLLVKNLTSEQARALARGLFAQMTETVHLRHQAQRLPSVDVAFHEERHQVPEIRTT